MKFHLIYPKWKKMKRQTEFHLPPHGPAVFAATIPAGVEVVFTDENVEDIDFDEAVDFVGISVMLTCQVKRGWEIAGIYRAKGIKVIFGGIGAMLHPEETGEHADSVFLGEAEGRFEQVIEDFKNNKLKKAYNYLTDQPPIEIVGTARRDILNRGLYNYKGTQMVDLVHASRGCRFNCYPCCVSYLGGKNFRPRPYDKFIEEVESIDNNRLFLVDNSLAQNTQWELGLFEALKPLKRKWISHPLENNEKVVKAAAEAGCWYVYQAIFDDSRHIRDRIKMLKDYGIGIEGTILLGLDTQTEYDVKKLIDFLLEVDLDMAEFTVLTPFPNTKPFTEMMAQNRILSTDWDDYSADKVVFKPKNMSAEKLQELFEYAWDTFYNDESQPHKMFKLFKKVLLKEMDDGTFKRGKGERTSFKFGKK
ncbi:MAG: cobalamin-dependent protein [Bacteroidota bacterium]